VGKEGGEEDLYNNPLGILYLRGRRFKTPKQEIKRPLLGTVELQREMEGANVHQVKHATIRVSPFFTSYRRRGSLR